MDFETLGLQQELVRAVQGLGFTAPMPIQEKAIPALLSGKSDFVGLAQTGTGKTGAFGLPLIQRIDMAIHQPQGIVICPTRELCLQITNDLKKYAAHMEHVGIAAVYGGASISTQIRQFKSRPRIIVATPGRLIDLMNRKVVNLSRISHAVLDEADEMLNMGFQEDIDRILSNMPENRRIWLFSATMPPGVAAISRKYLADPVEVTVGGKNRGAENITHACYVVHEKNRYQGLKRIIDFTPDMFGLVFCRTRKDTQSVAEALMRDGYQADALHGDLSQSQRDYVMRKFRQRTVRLMVATDVAARGLDVDDITHVIHYQLPDEAETYTHRSGRTARAGKSGQSIALINPKEKYRIRNLEKRGKIRFDFRTFPNGKDICKKQLADVVEKLVKTDVDEAAIADFLPAVYDALDGLDREELIQRFVSAEFNRFLEYYRHKEDINVKPRSKQTKNSGPAFKNNRFRDNRDHNDKKVQRFFINVGRLDKINEGAILRLVCEKCGIRSNMIGAIDLNREFSFFDVDKRAASTVRNALNNAKLDGRRVQVRSVNPDKKAWRKNGPRRMHA